MTHFPVEIQTSPQLVPSVPSWFGEVAIVATFLKKEGLFEAISQQVRLTRGRMGDYEVIDFVALLIGYALSAEPTLQAFFDRLLPFATPFMGLFERDHLPHRSSLSRFLAAVDPTCLEQLRILFLQDLCARPLAGSQEGGLWDRSARQWYIFDIDGTRAVARQRALPHPGELPAAKRRFDEVCAKGYAGRKRGEVVRTRTVIEQVSTHQWLGTFSGKGNGQYRAELQRGLQVIIGYLSTLDLLPARAIIRLDGLYGTGTAAFCLRTDRPPLHNHCTQKDLRLRTFSHSLIEHCFAQTSSTCGSAHADRKPMEPCGFCTQPPRRFAKPVACVQHACVKATKVPVRVTLA